MIRSLMVSLGLLNSLDGYFTFIGLQAKIIDELNPIMAQLYVLDPYYFLLFKFLMSLLIIFVGFYFQTPRQSIWSLSLLCICFIYMCTIVAHFHWLIQFDRLPSLNFVS